MEEEDMETKTIIAPLHLDERTCVRSGPTEAAWCSSSPSGSVRATHHMMVSLTLLDRRKRQGDSRLLLALQTDNNSTQCELAQHLVAEKLHRSQRFKYGRRIHGDEDDHRPASFGRTHLRAFGANRGDGMFVFAFRFCSGKLIT